MLKNRRYCQGGTIQPRPATKPKIAVLVDYSTSPPTVTPVAESDADLKRLAQLMDETACPICGSAPSRDA